MNKQLKEGLATEVITKQRITLGSILEINIDNKYFSYAQILTKGDCAFFDYKSTE